MGIQHDLEASSARPTFIFKRISHKHITLNMELYSLWEDFCSLLKELTNLAARYFALLSQIHLQRHRQEDDEALQSISVTLISRYRLIDLLNFRQQINKMPPPPKKKPWRAFIQLAISGWGGLSTGPLSGTVPLWRHESVQWLTASLWYSCAASHLRPWEEPQINFAIMIQFTSLSMILCLCFTNGSTRLSMLTVQHPSSHPAPPTKRGIPHMCPAVPPMSPILPSSSNIHCRSLSLKDHYCQCYDWTHSDGCMALLFQRFFFIVSLHYSSSHHRSIWKRVPWNSCHFSSSCWGIIKSAALGLRTELVAHALRFWFASLIGLDRSNVLKVKNASVSPHLTVLLSKWVVISGKTPPCNTTVIVNYVKLS